MTGLLLQGKVSVITGGGAGIGKEHALLQASLGAKVLVVDPGGDVHGAGRGGAAAKVVEEIREAGGEATPCTIAVGDFAAAGAIVDAARDAYGGLDILVNNAGILRDRTILNMNPDEWEDVIRVHLTGTFACLQAAARQMIKQGRGGRIINTSSSSGLLGNFGQANYGAAKSGIHALTRIAAEEFAKYLITVNALSPTADTRMTHDLPGFSGAGPEYMAPLVAYFASDLSARITGQTIGVDGNYLYAYKMMTTKGRDKEDGKPWDPAAIDGVIDKVINW